VKHSLFAFFILILLLFLSNACNRSSQNREAIFKSRSQKKSDYRIATVSTIGVELAENDEQLPYQFESISSIDCDRSGNLYVLIGKTNCVRVFDQSGQFLRQMLRRGKGPNEIVGGFNLKINRHSNSFYVLHENGYHLKQFDLQGNYIETFPLPEQFFHHYYFTSKYEMLFLASVQRGDVVYDNIKILDLSTRKITGGFLQSGVVKRDDSFNIWQRFVIKDKLLWTCTLDNTDLKAVNMKTILFNI